MVRGPRPSDVLGGPASSGASTAPAADHSPRVALARTAQGWTVIPVAGSAGGEPVADVIEGMTLADLVADELGASPEPDRTARRSARGPSEARGPADDVDVRITALERTVAQLEHALAARVSTERAIGVLAERNGSSLRTAFEDMRRQARTEGRPVVDLAREVLAGLAGESQPGAAGSTAVPATTPLPRPDGARRGPAGTADGRS